VAVLERAILDQLGVDASVAGVIDVLHNVNGEFCAWRSLEHAS
jgi:hypothetical protein